MRRRTTMGCAALLGMAGLLLSAVVMVGASNLGGGAAPDADRRPATLDEVRARTVAAPQARYAAEVHLEVAPHQVLVVAERGAYDRATGHAWTETTVRDPSRPAGTSDPQVVERLRITPDQMYVQPGDPAARALGLRPTAWLAAETPDADHADDVAQALGGLGPELAALGSRTGPSDLRRVGIDRIRGVATSHVAVDADGAGAEAEGPDAVDVWIDRQGRLRRMEVMKGSTTARLDVFAYDAPVPVEEPDVTEATTNAAEVLRTTLTALAAEGRP